MVSLYARAVKGKRAYSKRPLKRGKNISIIGAMTLNQGFLTGLSFDGGTNGDLFLWFIEEILVPQLWAGAVVVMDNLPAHKVQGVSEAIASVGARLVYLSPYSPDFNPIEHLWSKLKSYLRSVQPRTRQTAARRLRSFASALELVKHCIMLFLMDYNS